MFTPSQKSLFESILMLAQQEVVSVYLIGGTIRDMLLQDAPYDNDLDFVVEGDAPAFGRVVARALKGEISEFPQFFTAKVSGLTHFGGINEIDFASARKEIYSSPGELPQVTPATLYEDLKRRDFTINALALPLQEMVNLLARDCDTRSLKNLIVDHFSGLKDIEERKVRILHDQSFVDDPTRLFRAMRYAARIGGELESRTEVLARAALTEGALGTISSNRKLNELKKIFAEQDPLPAFKLLIKYGVFNFISLVDVQKLGPIVDAFERLRDFRREVTHEVAYEVALALFYRSHQPKVRRERFQAYGFGKKTFRLLDEMIEVPEKSEFLMSAPNAPLVCWYLLSKEEGVSFELGEKILKERNLFK